MRDEETLAAAFVNDAVNNHALEKLSRYEVRLDRSLSRALDKLRDLQAARRNPATRVPVVIDVESSWPAST